MRKQQVLEKYEAHMPNKINWVQGEHYASFESENFHSSYVWRHNVGCTGGTTFGIQKKLHHASCYGYQIDGYYVGKSENI